MPVLRPLLIALLALGLAGLVAAPERPALLVGLLALLLAFLLGFAKLAIDLIELSPRELSADAIALAAVAVGMALVTSASRTLLAGLIVFALIAHAVPLALGRRSSA